MNRTRSGPILLVLTCLTAAFLVVRSGHTDETPKKDGDPPAASESAKKSQADVKKTSRRFRLPNHYGKLGLSDEQKQQVYAIQAKFQPQFDELEEKIRLLKIERKKEIDTVLTDGQRHRLKEILQEVQRQRKERRSARESDESPDAK